MVLCECRICGCELNNSNWYPSRRNGNRRICNGCARDQQHSWDKLHPEIARNRYRSWAIANPEKKKASAIKHIRKKGALPYNENRQCSSFLGVHVAERVLSCVFKNVERMPMSNPGYDFICNNGKKIDVKSACINHSNRGHRWQFHIKKNTVADYFLCLAFDNREDLNPLHIWLIPGIVINHLDRLSISLSTTKKVEKYELDVGKVVTCCDVVR